MKNTTIVGLSHIKRNGDAVIGNKNGTFDAKLRMGDQNVKVHADVYPHFIKFIHPHIRVESQVGDIDILIQLTVDGNGKFVLENFEIDEFKHVKIQVHGLALLDPLIDLIADGFIQFFNPNARQLITKFVRPVIEEEIKKFTPSSY